MQKQFTEHYVNNTCHEKGKGAKKDIVGST